MAHLLAWTKIFYSSFLNCMNRNHRCVWLEIRLHSLQLLLNYSLQEFQIHVNKLVQRTYGSVAPFPFDNKKIHVEEQKEKNIYCTNVAYIWVLPAFLYHSEFLGICIHEGQNNGTYLKISPELLYFFETEIKQKLQCLQRIVKLRPMMKLKSFLYDIK